MPRILLLVLAGLLGTSLAHARRPPALSGERLEAAKVDWCKVSAGQLSAADFKTRYGLTNGSMTRLRKSHPGDFGKLDLSLRERQLNATELKALARDWRRVGAGELTLTQLKEQHGLGGDTLKRVIAEHRDQFPEIEVKLGGRRLAEQRRAERLDPVRVGRLADAWDREILTGTLSLEKFYARHATSKKEITELRKAPGSAGRFASATGIASTQRKQTLSSAQVSELSRLWKSSVVPGATSIDEFKRAQGLTQRKYRELRQDRAAFPDPEQVKHDGGPERRSFTASELAAIKADWQKVLDLELDRAAFLKKHGLHSAMMKRLRDEHPQDFSSLSGMTRRTQFAGPKLEAMRDGWLLVIAGRKREVDFRDEHKLSTSLFARLRVDGELAADFPKLKARAEGSAEGAPRAGAERPRRLRAGSLRATSDPAAIKDWAEVRAGSLAPGEFRRRHPDVRAADLVGLQALARSAGKRSLAEELGLVKPAEKPVKVAAAPRPRPEPKPRPESKYVSKSLYTDSQLTEARALFARHQRGELELQRDVAPALRKLGITTTGQGLAYLRGIDPVAFASREEFLGTNHAAIVTDLVRIARAHRHVIRKWSDLAEVVAKDTAFAARWGQLKIDPMVGVARRDRDTDGRLRDAMAAIGTQVGKQSGPNGAPAPQKTAEKLRLHRGAPEGREQAQLLRGGGCGRRREAPGEGQLRLHRGAPEGHEQAQFSTPAAPRQDSARALAAALRGLEPTTQTLEKVVARLGRTDPNFATRRKWMSVRAEFEGVFPELARWNFDAHRPYSLRYVARWTEAAHQAGPGASYEEIAALFQRSVEYKEDGRLPPKASGTVIMAKQHPELIASWANRRTFQRTRQLLELLRTAPQGATLYSLGKQVEAIGLPLSYAQTWVKKLSAADADHHGMPRATFEELKRSGFRGLGQARNPSFDPALEPPGVDMSLVRDILDTPRMPKLLELAISRLDGRRPFESHNVMFINHRYSDIVSLVDAMARAGMQRENAVFVSTPYPFKNAVTYQLEKSGVRTIVPELSMASYARSVEKGIRQMLKRYEEQKRKWGAGKPILILDDGGMASKIIASKFPQHASKFRIVEVTAAGVRLAKEFQEQHGRLPFVYYSIAHTALKQRVTSSFYGRRVAQRVLNLIPQTGVTAINRRVAILGGGPMGLFAGRELRRQGYEVTFVDPDPLVAARLHDTYKFNVTTIEKALPGRGLILGMSGYETVGKEHLSLIEDGAILAQGSSKRGEFAMGAFERMARKTLLPREDGLAQKSFTYSFRGGKKLHFLGDGWTINHDGSLHGTPMRDIQLELALYFESAVQAASTPLGQTGVFREVGAETQRYYFDRWRKARLK